MAITINGNGTVTGISAGGLPDGCIQEADLAAGVNTITEADHWVLTADVDTNDYNPITTNWARPNFSGGAVGQIGTGMSESSGIFTFPSTGIWYVSFTAVYYDAAINKHSNTKIQATSNDSDYHTISINRTSNYRDDGNHYTNAVATTVLDITNTSTHKVRFSFDAEHVVTLNGNSGRLETGMIFIRLGDT